MKVAIVCPIYNMYPQVISSMICQTYPHWELTLIHNGPVPTRQIDQIVARYADPRVHLKIHPQETGLWGHPLRAWALEKMKTRELMPDADLVVVTNADNYYAPPFLEQCVSALQSRPDAVAAYASKMVHNYLKWDVITVGIALGTIDCGGVMLRKDIACDVGWRSFEHSSDWTFFADILTRHGGPSRWVPIPGCTFVHN